MQRQGRCAYWGVVSCLGGLLHQAAHLCQYAYLTGCSESAFYSQTALFIQNSWSLVEGGTEERHLGKLREIWKLAGPHRAVSLGLARGQQSTAPPWPRAGYKGGFVKCSHALSVHLSLSLRTAQGLTSLVLWKGMSRPTRHAP